MEEIECVRSFFDAFNARDWTQLRMSLDARFAFRGAPPLTQFMDSATFIEALQSFVEAVPDFTFQESIEHTQDNAVTVSIRPHGTHTRAFVFPMALLPASPTVLRPEAGQGTTLAMDRQRCCQCSRRQRMDMSTGG